jgi:hypothetical protein
LSALAVDEFDVGFSAFDNLQVCDRAVEPIESAVCRFASIWSHCFAGQPSASLARPPVRSGSRF